jgi:hypothetical protein
MRGEQVPSCGERVGCLREVRKTGIVRVGCRIAGDEALEGIGRDQQRLPQVQHCTVPGCHPGSADRDQGGAPQRLVEVASNGEREPLDLPRDLARVCRD